jgi:gas vesicle structural protein
VSTSALSEREVSLVEVLDRALGAGVVITGDVTLSLADIDLVYLSLRLVVGSVPTLFGDSEEHAQRGDSPNLR